MSPTGTDFEFLTAVIIKSLSLRKLESRSISVQVSIKIISAEWIDRCGGQRFFKFLLVNGCLKIIPQLSSSPPTL